MALKLAICDMKLFQSYTLCEMEYRPKHIPKAIPKHKPIPKPIPKPNPPFAVRKNIADGQSGNRFVALRRSVFMDEHVRSFPREKECAKIAHVFKQEERGHTDLYVTLHLNFQTKIL
ncbi:hypothetical protein Btru_070556 [Bulinus truncatus]|nr:hypothetical protein Btru_070556 [Bulinus truncatus]